MTGPNPTLAALNEQDLWQFKRFIREFTLAEQDNARRVAAHEVWRALLDECERRINKRSTVLKDVMLVGRRCH